jgi:hypothetical protein
LVTGGDKVEVELQRDYEEWMKNNCNKCSSPVLAETTNTAATKDITSRRIESINKTLMNKIISTGNGIFIEDPITTLRHVFEKVFYSTHPVTSVETPTPSKSLIRVGDFWEVGIYKDRQRSYVLVVGFVNEKSGESKVIVSYLWDEKDMKENRRHLDIMLQPGKTNDEYKGKLVVQVYNGRDPAPAMVYLGKVYTPSEVLTENNGKVMVLVPEFSVLHVGNFVKVVDVSPSDTFEGQQQGCVLAESMPKLVRVPYVFNTQT